MKKPGPPMPEEEVGGGDLEVAAQDFLDAQAAGDAAGVAAAFKAMHAICNSYSDEPLE